jgi:hypothetical protein
MIKLTGANQSITDSDLDAVEQELGFQFPQQFRDLYLQYNGGQPERGKRRFENDEGSWIFHGFLPIRHQSGPVSILERSFYMVRVKNQSVPEFLVPFGFDDFGNYFCFSTRDTDFGAVYFCVMDARDPRRLAKFLTGSLNEFLEKLTPRN